jgi:hypothetical protein
MYEDLLEHRSTDGLDVLTTDVGDRSGLDMRKTSEWSGAVKRHPSRPRRSSSPTAMLRLTPTGRLRLASCVVDDGWPLRRAAERFGVSVTTAQRWSGRYRGQGQAGMGDRSSRPNRCPSQLPTRIEHRIMGLRVSRRWGPARIDDRLRLNPATVGKVFTRYEAPRLAWTDPATGCRLRAKPKPFRYEHAAPGTWGTWTSRSWTGSPTVAVTASWAARPGSGSRRAPSRGPRTSTTPWMTTPVGVLRNPAR